MNIRRTTRRAPSMLISALPTGCTRTASVLLAAGAALLGGCSMMPDMPTIGMMTGNEAPAEVAVAQVQPTVGNEVSGTVKFTRRGDDTLVEIALAHLTPGTHGFHVHEKGDCSAPDGMSAGGHFNPDGHQHGAQDGPHHTGDLGNVVAGADGTVNLNEHIKGLLISGDHGVAGRAVIVHANADDLKTQPTGNAGKRLACGTIVHN